MSNRLLFVFFALSCITVRILPQDKADALELYMAGEYEDAILICEQELEETPKSMDSYTVLSWSLIELGRYEEALEYARRGLQISRGDYRIIEVVGEALFYQSQFIEALGYFEEYIVLALPDEKRIDDVYYFMGECYINLKEYNNADVALTTALYFQPNIADRWARLGYAREMAGYLVWSLDAFERALALNASHREAREGRIRVERKISQSGE